MNTFNEIVNYINDLKSEKIKILFDYYFLLFLSIYGNEYVFIKIFKYHIILNGDNKPVMFKTYEDFENYVIDILLKNDKKQ